MENYKSIINFLNSSDPDIVSVGLQYLKQCDLKISGNNSFISSCNDLLRKIGNDNFDWKWELDFFIYQIIEDNPELDEFYFYNNLSNQLIF